MKRLFGAIAVLVCCLSVRGAQVTITDNVQTVFGAVLGGTITSVHIAWTTFVAADGTHVSAGSTDVAITGGAFSYSLTPSIGSTPFGAYTFTMSSTSGALRSFSIGVPASTDPTPLSFNQLQITSPWLSWGLGLGPSLGNSGGSSGGSTNGNATSIAGILLSTTTPTDGQGWLFDSTSSQLQPVAIQFWKKYQVPYSRLTSISSTTGTVTLFARGARQKLCGISMYVSPSFVAPGLTNITATVGDSNGTGNLYTPVAASVIDNGNKDFSVTGSATGYGNVTATFTATGANLSALTAGNVDIVVCSIIQP